MYSRYFIIQIIYRESTGIIVLHTLRLKKMRYFGKTRLNVALNLQIDYFLYYFWYCFNTTTYCCWPALENYIFYVYFHIVYFPFLIEDCIFVYPEKDNKIVFETLLI